MKRHIQMRLMYLNRSHTQLELEHVISGTQDFMCSTAG